MILYTKCTGECQNDSNIYAEAPFDCHGPAGTVIVWHHKLLHRAGLHRNENSIRMGTLSHGR